MVVCGHTWGRHDQHWLAPGPTSHHRTCCHLERSVEKASATRQVGHILLIQQCILGKERGVACDLYAFWMRRVVQVRTVSFKEKKKTRFDYTSSDCTQLFQKLKKVISNCDSFNQLQIWMWWFKCNISNASLLNHLSWQEIWELTRSFFSSASDDSMWSGSNILEAGTYRATVTNKDLLNI